jgi:hypothetical protein
MLTPRDADGDRLAEQQVLQRIRMPVHGGYVAAQSDVFSELDQFTAHGDLVRIVARVRQ